MYFASVVRLVLLNLCYVAVRSCGTALGACDVPWPRSGTAAAKIDPEMPNSVLTMQEITAESVILHACRSSFADM